MSQTATAGYELALEFAVLDMGPVAAHSGTVDIARVALAAGEAARRVLRDAGYQVGPPISGLKRLPDPVAVD